MDNQISKRLLDFSSRVIILFKNERYSFIVNNTAKQLIRSSSSAGANYEEACSAESRADFIHKLQICLKELRESKYWLILMRKTSVISKNVDDLVKENIELMKIIASSVITAKSNARRT